MVIGEFHVAYESFSQIRSGLGRTGWGLCRRGLAAKMPIVETGRGHDAYAAHIPYATYMRLLNAKRKNFG